MLIPPILSARLSAIGRAPRTVELRLRSAARVQVGGQRGAGATIAAGSCGVERVERGEQRPRETREHVTRHRPSPGQV